MCGITGIWNRHGSVTDIVAAAELMTLELRHRGPDDQGVWSEPAHRIVLGHRRLSILDLSFAGHQPMVGPQGAVIAFNGEIYNFRKLKERFFPEEVFNSSSDTEVLLRLYEKLGKACVTHLEGMFAFAIWDPNRQELFIARDRAGKKPVYYTEVNGSFAFASEIKALVKLPGFLPKTDPAALYHFLTYNLLPPPLTMFEGVSKLPPAHTLTLRRDGAPMLERYWSPVYTDLSGYTDQELTDRTFHLLEDAVDARLVSDVPVGAFLSGGVDSSAVVALMSRRSDSRVRTYSIGFDGQDAFDERMYAERVARMFDTDHHERIVRKEEIIGLLPEIVTHFDEPLADATCIPLFFLSRQAASDGTPVVLTGDGSDEVFAGYRSWSNYRRLYPFYEAYSRMPRLLTGGLSALYRQFGRSDVRKEMLERAAARQEFFWGGAKSFKESSKREVLSASFNATTAGMDSHEVIRRFREQFSEDFTLVRKDPIDWMCYLGFHFNIPNYYLHRLDRMGMAHAVEIRAPFLDRALVEFGLSLDPRLKLHRGEPKYLLKKSLERVLPAELLYRRKRGFNVPLKEWALEVLLQEVDTGLRSFCNDFPYFDEQGLRQHVDRLRRGDTDVVNRLWTVFFLMRWFRYWMR
ncbi:MAG: Asparagine synthetase 1 [Bacteroidota bacterium]|jgi:asparagine synthase (glutamine-hydrolysing)